MQEAHPSLPLETLWAALLDGDPGPAVAFADLLLDHDLPYAAGGFLHDLAERYRDADELITAATARQQFRSAVHTVLSHGLDHDPAAVAELLEGEEDTGPDNGR